MKITYSIKTWSIMALTALLPACSSDDSRQTIDDTPHGPMVFSSTMNGSYDLYYYDGSSVSPLTELNSHKDDLGADFFAADSYKRILR